MSGQISLQSPRSWNTLDLQKIDCSCSGPLKEKTLYLNMQSVTLLYRHSLNTDTLLLLTLFFVPGEKALTFSLTWTRLQTHLLIRRSNGHFFLAQSTSLMQTHHHQLSAVTDLAFLNAIIILQFTVFQCSQCYNTADRMICSCQFETILASFKLCREWFGLTL